jgi:hypothetical protein
MYIELSLSYMSRGSSVGKNCMTEETGFSGVGSKRIVVFSTKSRPVLRPTQPQIQWLTEAASLQVKWQGREADRSPPSRAEAENGGTVPALLIRLHGAVLN